MIDGFIHEGRSIVWVCAERNPNAFSAVSDANSYDVGVEERLCTNGIKVSLVTGRIEFDEFNEEFFQEGDGDVEMWRVEPVEEVN